MNDITLMTCSYNTPLITKGMLQSFVKVHGNGPHNILISENSTDDETATLLDTYDIPYIRNKGATHAQTLDQLFDKCKTRYALVVDTDILFFKSITPLLKTMYRQGATVMGEVCGDRGGYWLYKRVHPWFMLVNVEAIQWNGIKFYDAIRIERTGSEGFYKNIPIQENDNKTRYYDVGATFYEDVVNANLLVYAYKADPHYFQHFEGMSWRPKTGNTQYIMLNDLATMEWEKTYSKLGLQQVNLEGKFK